MRSLFITLAAAAALALPAAASARPAGPVGAAFAHHTSPPALADTVEPASPPALADTVEPAPTPSPAGHVVASSSDDLGTLGVIGIVAGGLLAATAVGAGAARLRTHTTVPQV